LATTPPRVTTCPAQRVFEQVVDLAVDAAQLVAGPALEGVEDLRIEAQQESFPFGHAVS